MSLSLSTFKNSELLTSHYRHGRLLYMQLNAAFAAKTFDTYILSAMLCELILILDLNSKKLTCGGQRKSRRTGRKGHLDFGLS